MGDLARQSDGLGLVRERKTQRAHFGGKELDGVVAAFGEFLGAGHHADAQEIRHRVAAGDQQMHVLGRDRLIFVRHHRGVDDAADQRLIAVVVAADGGELHVLVGNAEFRQRRARQHVGHRVRRRHRNLLALEILDLADLVIGIDAVRHHDPVAAEQLHVAALGVGGKHALRPALEAVELAGDQRLERELVVLELRDLRA